MSKINRTFNNALIIFTREPVAGKTKTRLMPFFTPKQCEMLHQCFLQDISRQTGNVVADIVVSYTGGEPSFLRKTFGPSATYLEQIGDNLGERMSDAIARTLQKGYEKVVLIGTDIPEIEAKTVNYAFDMLEASDVVIGPTEDGGYYLIGMKKLESSAFNVKKYGSKTVMEDTRMGMLNAGLSVLTIDTYNDIDTAEDVQGYRERMREDAFLRKSATGKFLESSATISVIIPIYNESNTINRMMEQLHPYKDDCEIIFVDGGSNDDTLDKIGEEFTVISGEKGRALQMNTGALASSGDILFFLHCDSILPQNFTSDIRRVMAGNVYGCFGVKFSSNNFFMWTNRVISNHRAWHRGLPFGDQGIFIDRKLFFEIGMFPELPIMEDYEFGRRLLRYGYKPGRTHGRIETSGRRYEKGTLGILKTEYKMWNLRRLYRSGVDIEIISKKYRDIR